MSSQLSLDLFDHSRYPYKPLCYDLDPEESRRRPLSEAIKCTNMQVNPAHALYWIVIDIDTPVITDPISAQMAAILDGDLPMPNFLLVNPDKQTAHAFYALARPVAKATHHSLHALRYTAAIESALIRGFGADPLYGNLLAKNPFSPLWRKIVFRSDPYTLHELDASLDLAGPSKSEMRAEALELGEAGRNVMLFDKLRYYAYQYVKMFKEDSTFENWKNHLAAKADGFNVFDHKGPMPQADVKHIVKSVAKWTWSRYTGRLSDKAFGELQAYRGSKGGRISAKVRAEAALAEGTTLAEKLSKIRSKGISENQPWKDLGISRAQWYRDQKSSNRNNSQG